jgi:molecular chaperone DnaJ
VADGMELRVPGGGQDGRFGGPAGDLYVSLRVKPHPVFERRGQDLVCALPVTMTQAALGAEVAIPTLEGDSEQVRVEAGTQSGTLVKLRGRGVPNIGRRGRGDLIVTIVVEIPTQLSKEARSLLEQLAELNGEVSRKEHKRHGRIRKHSEK